MHVKNHAQALISLTRMFYGPQGTNVTCAIYVAAYYPHTSHGMDVPYSPFSLPAPLPFIRMEPWLSVVALQQGGSSGIVDNLFRFRVPLDG